MRVENTDLCQLMGLYEDIMEESVKHDVYLPKDLQLLVHNPRANRKMELETDVDLSKVWCFGRSIGTTEMCVDRGNKQSWDSF